MSAMKKGATVLDLFCGVGGLSHGFKKEGCNVLLGIDFNKDALETFKANNPESKILCEDISKITAKKIYKEINQNEIDIVVGGPPCQGFSMAGKRQPNDPRNSLFKEYLRLVREIKPKVFVMENVRGLLSMKNEGGENVVDVILNEFKKMKEYNVELYKVNTADYGVPQRRQRIFIIGVKQGLVFKFPEPSHSQNKDAYNGKKLQKWIGVKEILLPKSKVDKKYYYSEKMIAGFLRRKKKNTSRQMGFGWQFLNPNEPSYTISARYWKDGAEALVKYNDSYSVGSIRKLTWQECAAIQSFPKDFRFVGIENEIYRQIGNAVPPKMANAIAKSINTLFS